MAMTMTAAGAEKKKKKTEVATLIGFRGPDEPIAGQPSGADPTASTAKALRPEPANHWSKWWPD
jgi:hypothetical protein